MKTRLLNFIRRLFANLFFEEIFLFFLSRNNDFILVRKLIPSNILYSAGTYRKAERDGINYILDLSDYQEWLVYYYSNADSSSHLLKYLGGSQIIFDVGANIGQTSFAIYNKTKDGGSKIFSFEPYPITHERFLANMQLNPQINNIQIENKGLGAEDNHLFMHQGCKTNSGGSKIVDSKGDDQDLVRVEVTTIDHYIAERAIPKVDFIKIDVEGFEYSVLRGAQKVIEKYKPKLYIELDDSNLKEQGSSAAELIKYLKSYNYKIINVNDDKEIYQETNVTDHIDIFCE